MHATFVLKCGKCRLRMQQCNAMESCTMFMTFFPYFVILILIWFLRKTQIDSPFDRGDNSCNLILSFANLSGNSLRVYVLFDLNTWPFWSDGKGVIWCLINPLKTQGLSPSFHLKHRRVRTFDLPLGSLKAYAQCPSLPQCRALRYQPCLLSWPCSKEENVQVLKNEFSRTRNIWRIFFSIDRLSQMIPTFYNSHSLSKNTNFQEW